MPAAPHADYSAPPAPLRGIGFTDFNHRDASPVRLVLNISSELPERPKVQFSVEPSPLAIPPYTLWIPDGDDGVQPLRIVHDGFGNLVQLVVRDAALLCANPLHNLQQFLPPQLAPQVEVVPSHSSQLQPVEVGFARLGVHRTRHVSDPQVHGKNRGVGCFQFNLTLHDDVQEVFAVSPEQFGLANLKVISDYAMGLDGNPYTAAAKFDRDANPVASELGVSPLDSNEVFPDGERVFPLRLNAFVESLSLLLVCGVEFNAGVALEESLEFFVFMVEDLSLNVGQPDDLRLDDFLYLHLGTDLPYHGII